MSIKVKVKVIKRDERNRESVHAPPPREERSAERQVRREASATVAGWVAEHRLRRQAEARQAAKRLLPEINPLPDSRAA